MGELDQAQKLIGTLLEEQPRDVKALHLDAAVALRRNDHERAERLLSTALIELPRTDIMLPERAAVLQLLVETLVALGRSTEALVYQKVLADGAPEGLEDRKSTRLNSSHVAISYAVFCLKKKTKVESSITT